MLRYVNAGKQSVLKSKGFRVSRCFLENSAAGSVAVPLGRDAVRGNGFICNRQHAFLSARSSFCDTELVTYE